MSSADADVTISKCLHAYPARPVVDVSALDDAFWERARTTGVAVIIAEQLGVRTAATKALAMGQAVAAMRSEALTMKCLRVCAEIGVRALPLKGPFLAKRLYGDIAWRPTSDVDLLIAHADVKRLITRLAADGAIVPEAHVHAYYEKEHHHLNVSLCGVLIELHFRATHDFGVFMRSEPLLDRSTVVALDGQPTRQLETNDEIVYLAVHAAAHFFASDMLLLDLKVLQQKSGANDLAIVERRARDLRLERAVGVALVAAERRVGFDASQMSAAWRATSVRLLDRIPRDIPPGYVDEWRVRFKQYAAKTRMCSTPSLAVRTIGHGALRATRRRLHARWPSLLPASWEV